MPKIPTRLARTLLTAALMAVTAPPAMASDEEGQGHHANHAAIFVGATIHDSHAYPTAGLDYERLVHEQVGIAAFAELIFAKELAQIAGAGVAWHPITPIKVAVLGGVEMSDGHSAFLMRGALEYAIHAGSMTLSPALAVDYVEETVIYVAGVAVGVGF